MAFYWRTFLLWMVVPPSTQFPIYANSLMYQSETSEPDRHFFRCQVPEEDSSATIIINGKKIPITIQDKSIDGFSVLIERRNAKKVQIGPQWILQAGSERTEVLAQWMFNAPDGCLQIGLRRLQDLTPPPKDKWLPSFRAYRKQTVNPDLVLAGMVITIVLALSLPGIGDRLGTAGAINDGAAVVFNVLKETIQGLW